MSWRIHPRRYMPVIATISSALPIRRQAQKEWIWSRNVESAAMPMTILLRVAAAACFVTLGALSLLPAIAMTRTDFGGLSEHVVAYLGTTLVTGMAFRVRPTLGAQCAFLILYAAVLELLQHFAPGRTPAAADFVAGAAGVALGSACLWIARDRVARWLRLD